MQVEYAISQWTSGQLVKAGQFTEAAYHDVYKCHLSSLEAWKALNSVSPRALANHKTRLYDNGRYVQSTCPPLQGCSLLFNSIHAGMAPAHEATKSCVTAGRLARAARAIQEEDLD